MNSLNCELNNEEVKSDLRNPKRTFCLHLNLNKKKLIPVP